MVGDLEFQALRRAWINAAAVSGVKTFRYLFTDPQAAPIAPGGEYYYLFLKMDIDFESEVSHTSELAYVYGQIVSGGKPGPGFSTLSPQMMDYWVSFATSLDPNDGKGGPRE